MHTTQKEKAKQYEKIRHRLFFLNLVLSCLLLVASFAFGEKGGLSSWFVRWIELFSPHFLVTVAVYGLGGLLAAAFLFFPLKFYSSFILEHRYGLSTETLRGWLWDWLKAVGIDAVMLLLMLEVVYAFMHWSAENWWLWAATAWVLFAVVLCQLFPVLILPLFYKLKPVEKPMLVQRLTRLAEKVRATVLGVFVMDMSRKTKKANAMLAGLGKTKRIILGDTLLSHYTDDEIEVILAHELAHYHYHHLWKKIAIGALIGFVGLYCVDQALDLFIPLFGFQGLADVANFPLFLLVLTLFFLVLMPLDNTLSRYYEQQCDTFALKQTKAPSSFISAMRKLAEQNLADMEPHPFIEFLLHDHPAIGKRIRRAEQFEVESP